MIDWQPARRRLTGWQADLAEFATVLAAIFAGVFLISFVAQIARALLFGV